MGESMFDAFARRAVETMDRKRSIGILSGVAMAAVARPSQARAKSHGSSGKKKCFSQRAQCLDFVRNVACKQVPMSPAREGDRLIAQPANCVTLYTACCDAFALCDAAPGFACLTQRRVAATK